MKIVNQHHCLQRLDDLKLGDIFSIEDEIYLCANINNIRFGVSLDGEKSIELIGPFPRCVVYKNAKIDLCPLEQKIDTRIKYESDSI